MHARRSGAIDGSSGDELVKRDRPQLTSENPNVRMNSPRSKKRDGDPHDSRRPLATFRETINARDRLSLR